MDGDEWYLEKVPAKIKQQTLKNYLADRKSTPQERYNQSQKSPVQKGGCWSLKVLLQKDGREASEAIFNHENMGAFTIQKLYATQGQGSGRMSALCTR